MTQCWENGIQFLTVWNEAVTHKLKCERDVPEIEINFFGVA